MNDKQLYTTLIELIRNGLTANGWGHFFVLRSYQYEQVPVTTTPTVYIHKLPHARRSWAQREQVYNQDSGDFDVIETFVKANTYQIDMMLLQNTPQDEVSASDVIEYLADYLQSVASVKFLVDRGIGLEFIGNVRPNYFIDEKERHEMSPSFDLTITFISEILTKAQAAESIDGEIKRI